MQKEIEERRLGIEGILTQSCFGLRHRGLQIFLSRPVKTTTDLFVNVITIDNRQ